MKNVLLGILVFGVEACSRPDSGAAKDLVSQAWSPRMGSCPSEFVKFSDKKIELHPVGRAASELKVSQIVNNPQHPRHVMVVIDPEGSSGFRENDQLAMVFDLSGERLRLIGQGTPTNLHEVGPGNPNAKAFDLVRCPST